MKKDGQRITMLTCYDATFARLVDDGGVDAVLVGDSLGMVIQGEPNTLAVTVDDIVYHCRAVARGTRRAHIVGDMPFMSYQVNPEDALRAAGRILSHGHAEAVKLEGGQEMAETVRRIVRAGIPVMGHVGLTPQSVHQMGGFVVQGRDEEGARRIWHDARALQEAGAYALVLEGIPASLAAAISERLAIPTIGIGAGAGCDGQVLVLYDLLGLNAEFKPRFVKQYVLGHGVVKDAVARFVAEVRTGAFPDEAHSFQSRAAFELPAAVRTDPRLLGDLDADGIPLYGTPV
ncbi:MAG: 3-methyl-2-oxobutanoate hydroxymethyltransferase [Deltaproteobacteria bacterium]|nr:3-methyl-2-oxobutanoate hydroxymethyltransferase [Deltaproteobacteria bacterium]